MENLKQKSRISKKQDFKVTSESNITMILICLFWLIFKRYLNLYNADNVTVENNKSNSIFDIIVKKKITIHPKNTLVTKLRLTSWFHDFIIIIYQTTIIM